MLLFVLAQVTPVTPPAIPQLPPATMVVEPAGMLIAACDADGDGRTTRAELTACVKRDFDAIDTDRKGSLGYIAFADWAERWLGDRNALPSPFETDLDSDNRITLAEMETKMAEIFARLDRDHDGAVTRAEVLTIRTSPRDDDGRRGRRR